MNEWKWVLNVNCCKPYWGRDSCQARLWCIALSSVMHRVELEQFINRKMKLDAYVGQMHNACTLHSANILCLLKKWSYKLSDTDFVCYLNLVVHADHIPQICCTNFQDPKKYVITRFYCNCFCWKRFSSCGRCCRYDSVDSVIQTGRWLFADEHWQSVKINERLSTYVSMRLVSITHHC